MKKICIVTPDVIGPVKNGGIGTHCFYLAQTLAQAGMKVTLLFTGPLQNKSHKHWKKFYSEKNIEYRYLDDFETISYRVQHNHFLNTSFFVFHFLKENNFDVVHFQEWLANGMVTIQAKETINFFNNTTLTVTMHSSTQWQQEGMMRYSANPSYDEKLKWAEEYCVKHCDTLISPSKYMIRWAKDRNWQLPQKQTVIPYCYLESLPLPFTRAGSASSGQKRTKREVNPRHLIYFGRLETRKGLEYFIESVLQNKINNENMQKNDKRNLIEKISFLGKVGNTLEGNAKTYIRKKLGNIPYKIFSNLDTFEAIEYIKNSGGLVVIPSLIDNYPYTVVEMIENKIPFLCSNTGGIPEMVDKQILFDVKNKNSLAQKLEKAHEIPFENLKHHYDSKRAASAWQKWHGNLFAGKSKKTNDQKIVEKKVSICIPYYNYPKYLPLLLASIKNITYKKYEVVVVNDGSLQPQANEVFQKMKEQYPEFHFFEKENSGVGDTRNFAASKSKGEYLIFMDSDNLAYPNMIHDFLLAIQKSKADCVTCHFDAFDENFNGTRPEKILFKYFPLGPCTQAGILENIFGDANFIIKRNVFNEVNGFGTERDTSWEDWEFLAKLNLQGFTQKVVPKSLFWYRYTEDGFSRNTNQYKNHQRILRCYYEYYTPETQKIISGYVIPYFHNKENNFAAINQVINKVLPLNSKRRAIIIKMVKGVLNR